MNDSKKLGWVRFYRQSMDSSVWKNPTIWFVWSWCLLKANHETNKFPFNGNDILIERGSFISGILSAQKELPTLSTQNIRTAFDYLKSTGRITITSTNKFSIITIVKYNDFQDNNTQTNKPLTNHSQATNKPLTTNKNDKNVKKSSEQSSEPELPFDLPLEIAKLRKNEKRKDLRLVGYYFQRKGLNIPTKEVFQKELRRALAEAKTLKDFPDENSCKVHFSSVPTFY